MGTLAPGLMSCSFGSPSMLGNCSNAAPIAYWDASVLRTNGFRVSMWCSSRSDTSACFSRSNDANSFSVQLSLCLLPALPNSLGSLSLSCNGAANSANIRTYAA